VERGFNKFEGRHARTSAATDAPTVVGPMMAREQRLSETPTLHTFPLQHHARIQVLGRLEGTHQLLVDILVLWTRRLARTLLALLWEALSVALVQIYAPTSKLQLPHHRPGVIVPQPQRRMTQAFNITTPV